VTHQSQVRNIPRSSRFCLNRDRPLKIRCHRLLGLDQPSLLHIGAVVNHTYSVGVLRRQSEGCGPAEPGSRQ
jgi:hypothetical protein